MTIHSLILLFWFVAKGEEYHAFRQDARQQWDSVKGYFQKVSSHLIFSLDISFLFFKAVDLEFRCQFSI